METGKSKKDKTDTDLKSILLDKILELQGSTLSAREQISTLITFIQSVFEIDSVAVYANFASEKINFINSKSGKKHYQYIGEILENVAYQINATRSRFVNSLIPLSELDIRKDKTDNTRNDLNAFVYPIISPYAKQIYGIVLIDNPRCMNTVEEKKALLFILNYVIKIIEETDLSSQIETKDERLLLLSNLSSSLRGILKPERAIEVVLKGIKTFLKLDSIYFAKWHLKERRLEVAHEIVDEEKNTLKGFNHKVSKENPIIRLLYKNQYMTYRNKNIRRISHLFLGRQEPSLLLFLPVLIRNDLLGGIVCVRNVISHEGSTEDLRVTQDIAGQLAVILNQATLYEESLSTAQREFLLNSITTMIRDTLEVDEVLEKTAREVGQVFGVNACCAFIQKEDGSGFKPKSIWATKNEYKSKLAGLTLDYNASKKQVKTLIPNPITQSVAISDLTTNEYKHCESIVRDIGFKSYLACSLNRGNETLGVLVLVHFEQQRYWTNSEIQLLEAITDQVEMALSQAELHEHVQQTERQMNLLHQVSSAIRDSLNLSTVMARAAKDLGEILSASRCFIRRLKSVNPLVVLATEQEYINDKHINLNKAADMILDFEKDWLESLSSLPEVERASSILHIPNVEEKYKNTKEPLKSILGIIQLKSFLAVPLVARGQVIGSLCINQCDRERKFSDREIEFAMRVASEASVAVLNADLYTKIEYQAQRDSLTNIYNHAYFQTALHHEVERAKRTTSDLSVIMIDLDYLKPINDKFGHAAGDEAIKLVSGKLQQCLRQMDIVARYGGDEFAVLLPETNVEAAEQIAQRILEALNRTVHPDWGPLSASLGVAGTPHEKRLKESILKAADTALYISKKEGRNRVTVSRDLTDLERIEKKPIDRD